MKNKFLSIFAIAPFLMACNSGGVPAKGYAKWKKDIKEHISGTYKYKSCSYAYLKNVPAEPVLNETCYYYSEFTVNGTDYYSYYGYKNSTDELAYDMESGNEGYIYRLAVAVVKDDPSVGKLGTL